MQRTPHGLGNDDAADGGDQSTQRQVPGIARPSTASPSSRNPTDVPPDDDDREPEIDDALEMTFPASDPPAWMSSGIAATTTHGASDSDRT